MRSEFCKKGTLSASSKKCAAAHSKPSCTQSDRQAHLKGLDRSIALYQVHGILDQQNAATNA